MTDTSNEDIRALLIQLAQSQIETNRQIQETQQEIRITQEAVRDTQEIVRELTSDVNRVLARSAILDDVLLELRENSEQFQQNFIEHQRTTNAALNSLEAINLRLIDIITRG
ncbi:hypothetical protein H6G41_32475 [Tolypothrix sp. FACHB-123]|uniref:hypothetical protein n=1 Tax=Tolypothrix sp. FACHB-123 TaxID=2692868 RepID=UPI001686E076|nr:hypothetical protein [Tolypothrix sp. FACHB-123]MBD2359248.1 hypothetical protein [Tolypothrix sp. FACHB-123]